MQSVKMALAGVVAMLALAVIPAWGADYSGYSNEELAAKRGTLRDASDEERAAFRSEWQKRYQSMSDEERQKYGGRTANAPADGKGYRGNAGAGDSGAGWRKGQGGGAGGGKGNRQRNRARAGGGGGKGKGAWGASD